MSEDTYQSPFLREASARGFIYQGTHLDKLDILLSTQKIAAYIGFDPTADSLHVGNLVQIMWLRMLQKHGHTPIILVGGGTGRVGDPSGKDAQRQMMTDDTIAHNIAGIKKTLEQFIDFSPHSINPAILVDNNAWLAPINYLDFLREYGTHFTINRMLTFDSVKTRLERETPLTFLEFNYMLLQGYDFEQLFLSHNCVLELGGSDQWGNIICGVELIRRRQNKQVFGLTSPLVTTSSGAKMGKSAHGAVWLTHQKYAIFDFWQYWRNTDDADVGRFLRMFTDLPLTEIENLEKYKDAEINQAKIVLANAMTALCHGELAAIEAQRAAESHYSTAGQSVFRGLPVLRLDMTLVGEGISGTSLLVCLGLCASKGEARRLIAGGGVRINNIPLADAEALLFQEECPSEGWKISLGKKRHYHVVSA
ncbi:MAG: tyrosine--tRNA ligase [Alphaproteobacteria bacterium]|nr:MAG: tyrosine--tRNA ligase [Alphaproteobacteria bacterium]